MLRVKTMNARKEVPHNARKAYSGKRKRAHQLQIADYTHNDWRDENCLFLNEEIEMRSKINQFNA